MPAILVKDPKTGEQYAVEESVYRANPGAYDAVEGQQVAVDVAGDLPAAGAARGVALDDYQRTADDYQALTAEELVDDTRARVAEERFGGVGSTIKQAVRGAASGLSVGGSEVLLRAGETALEREDREAAREATGPAFTVGEIGGAIGGAVLSGGTGLAGRAAALTPTGAIARIGAGRGAAGLALEGAVGGALTGVSELALSENPLTLERAASVISSNALLGAGIGGGASLLGKAAEKGLAKARALADDAGETLRARGAVADDLAGLDKTALREARETELARLGGEAKATKAAAADELAAYRAEVKGANPYLATDDPTTRKLLVQQERTYRRLLDEPIGLAENPRRALDPLRREQVALRNAVENRAAQAEKLAAQEAKLADDLRLELDTLPDAETTVQLTGKHARRYGDWADAKVGKQGVSITREEAQTFEAALRSGEVQGARAQALDKLEGLIAKNEALQAKIVSSFEVPKSPRLDAIDKARDELGKPTGGFEKAALGYAATAATGILPGGPIGAIAALVAPKALSKIAELVKGRLAKASAASTKSGTAALDRFFGGVATAARALPRPATKVLGSTLFGAPAKSPLPSSGDDLADTYRERERELRASTTIGPDGRHTLTPAAREEVAARLAGVRAVSPMLADTIESLAARKAGFLASKLPFRPDAEAFQLGPDTWRPSEFAIRQYARYVDSVERPDGIEDRMADGTLTTEDAEVLREVYPERYNELRQALIERLPTLAKPLPFERRLALSILFDMTVDASTSQEVIAVLQGNFAAEQGSNGGTSGPKPSPQFGSVSRPEPTPAQARSA